VIIATHNQGLVDRFDHPQIRIAEGRVGVVERIARR
jgi:ABC-type ATPase involved in cell division